jgi:hypothetical protein
MRPRSNLIAPSSTNAFRCLFTLSRVAPSMLASCCCVIRKDVDGLPASPTPTTPSSARRSKRRASRLRRWTMSREDFQELRERAAEFDESLWATATARLQASTDFKMALAARP